MNHQNKIANLLNHAYNNLTSDNLDIDFSLGCVAEAKALVEGDMGSFAEPPNAQGSYISNLSVDERERFARSAGDDDLADAFHLISLMRSDIEELCGMLTDAGINPPTLASDDGENLLWQRSTNRIIQNAKV